MSRKRKETYKHASECETCFNMERRGYRSEIKYWDDLFDRKLKPIKYSVYYKGKFLTLKIILDNMEEQEKKWEKEKKNG